ncbi:MAG TPA: PAS domain-containing protein, partial [Noviherbaspirillum sp.]|nr:PAS domain-containing protein [Noviherbaspirillum sp.]
ALMRERDWASTPLGPPSGWSPGLRMVVRLVLDAHFPMYVAWGPQLVLIYNDAYAELLGARHPAALGRAFWDIWPEVKGEIGPVIRTALGGETVYIENQPLTLLRYGMQEHAWFTFSVSPARDESGATAGVYCVCTETTASVLLERERVEENQRLLRLFEQAPGLHGGRARPGSRVRAGQCQLPQGCPAQRRDRQACARNPSRKRESRFRRSA